MKAELENVQVWIVRLADESRERWERVLDEAELEKMRRFRMAADQMRFGVTRGVLRTLLAQYLGRSAGEIAFEYGAHGKPELRDGEMQFNVSHSGDYALLAFSRRHAVGVDVEHITGGEKRQFFQIWTLKEALLKAMGSGLSIEPEEIELEWAAQPPRVVRSPTPGPWSLAYIHVEADYAAALAVAQAEPVEADVRYLHD